jgi:hypothetical protein
MRISFRLLFMTSRRAVTTLLVTIYASVAMFFAYQGPAYARKDAIYKKTIKNNSLIVHDIQLLLTISTRYSAGIDGICGPKTADAIAAYINAPPNTPSPLIYTCNSDLIKSILPSLIQEISADKVAKGSNNNAFNLEISGMQKQVSDMQYKLSDMQNELTANKLKAKMDDDKNDILSRYNNDFNAFVALCILLVTLTATAAIGVGIWANDLVKKSRARTLELARKDLKTDIEVAKNEVIKIAETTWLQVAARIFTNLSAHCINLYRILITSLQAFQNIICTGAT